MGISRGARADQREDRFDFRHVVALAFDQVVASPDTRATRRIGAASDCMAVARSSKASRYAPTGNA
jgi:hypothetical protein